MGVSASHLLRKLPHLDPSFYAHVAVQTRLASALRNALLQGLELVVLPHLITQGHIFALWIEAEVAVGAVFWRAFK
jgi:hypothetical protein